MLKKLSIEQFVIIERLELAFEPGLTIVTGETGAGKSILLDATGLILGEDANPESVRQGAAHAVIEAVINPPRDNPVWPLLAARGVNGSDGLMVRRKIGRDGLDQIEINGQPVTLAILKEAGLALAEIHGQFANQSLMDPANQLRLLDLSGGFSPEYFKNVADALANVRRFTTELEDENAFLSKHRHELPKIEEVVGKLMKLGMKEGFVSHVENEYSILLTAKETSEAFQAIFAQLIASNGVVMGLSAANNILERNENLDEENMADLSDFLAIALENARAAVTEMRRIAPEYDIDTGPLDHYRDLLGNLKKISKEAKIPLEKLDGYFAEQSAKLKRIRNGRDTIAKLENALSLAKAAYIQHARILSEKRMHAGRILSEALTSELAPLKLGKAEFQVQVTENMSLPWTDLGLNEVVFTARMNPGMPFSPVAETASGGELARLILALKVVLQKVQIIPTLIFDEVDTGIGGAAAAAVGERLALLSETTQVLVITHSPQVAARGDQHLYVAKKTDGMTTSSDVTKLSLAERTDEISRMLAGDVITPESHAAAQSLIQEAGIAASSRRQAT